MKDILYIVIPAFNEEVNIENVINQWYPIVEAHPASGQSRLLIIDDGSNDDTFNKIRKCAISRPLLTPITKKNSGHGATILYGYKLAIEQQADYIFQTDSDGQTLPSEFEQFWKLRSDYDMVIGKRGKRQDGFSRIIVTKVLKMVLFICFGVAVSDANTPFRLMNVITLKKHINLIPKDFNLSNVMVSVVYEKKSLKVKYLPITFKPRQGGVNSLNLKKIFKIGIQAIRDFKEIGKTLNDA